MREDHARDWRRLNSDEAVHMELMGALELRRQHYEEGTAADMMGAGSGSANNVVDIGSTTPRFQTNCALTAESFLRIQADVHVLARAVSRSNLRSSAATSAEQVHQVLSDDELHVSADSGLRALSNLRAEQQYQSKALAAEEDAICLQEECEIEELESEASALEKQSASELNPLSTGFHDNFEAASSRMQSAAPEDQDGELLREARTCVSGLQDQLRVVRSERDEARRQYWPVCKLLAFGFATKVQGLDTQESWSRPVDSVGDYAHDL